jgi:hypothetical protein
VPGPGVPFSLVEPGQVADEEDDVPGVHVGADAAIGLPRVKQCGQCLADRAVAARGEVSRHRAFDGGEDPALDLGVVGQPIEPPSQCGVRLMLGEQRGCRRHELADIVTVDLGKQVLARREMAVESALADPRLPGDRVELHLAAAGDRLARGLDDPCAVVGGVGPEAGRVHRLPLCCDFAKRTHVR